MHVLSYKKIRFIDSLIVSKLTACYYFSYEKDNEKTIYVCRIVLFIVCAIV